MNAHRTNTAGHDSEPSAVPDRGTATIPVRAAQ